MSCPGCATKEFSTGLGANIGDENPVGGRVGVQLKTVSGVGTTNTNGDVGFKGKG
jgi:hypothetical protein